VLQSEALLKEKEDQRTAVQNELDDLLMVLGDLEEKAMKYKVMT
jgi:intracellular protein transport protein USO1